MIMNYLFFNSMQIDELQPLKSETNSCTTYKIFKEHENGENISMEYGC